MQPSLGEMTEGNCSSPQLSSPDGTLPLPVCDPTYNPQLFLLRLILSLPSLSSFSSLSSFLPFSPFPSYLTLQLAQLALQLAQLALQHAQAEPFPQTVASPPSPSPPTISRSFAHFCPVLNQHIILLSEIVCLHVEIVREEKPRRILGVWDRFGGGGLAALPYLCTYVYLSSILMVNIGVLCLTEPILGQGGPSYLWTLRLLRITHTSPHTRHFTLFHLGNVLYTFTKGLYTFQLHALLKLHTNKNIFCCVLLLLSRSYVDCTIWPFPHHMFISRDFYVDCVIRPLFVLTNAVQLQALECEGATKYKRWLIVHNGA